MEQVFNLAILIKHRM